MRDGRNSDGRLAVRQHEPALVFPDGHYAEEWRVEWIDRRGEMEVTIFAGPNARERPSGTRIVNTVFSRKSAWITRSSRV